MGLRYHPAKYKNDRVSVSEAQVDSVSHKHKVIGRAAAGETASVKLSEYGRFGKPGQVVELKADGQVDDFVLNLEPHATDKELIQLDDPRLQRFVARAVETVKPHQPGPGAQPWNEWTMQKRLTSVLESSDLAGLSHPRLGQDGHLHADAWLESQQRSIIQYVWLSHGPEGSKVSLTTERGRGCTSHVMEAPLTADNSIDLSRVEERLEIRVPWFDAYQLKWVGKNGLTDVADPRLSKVLNSVDRGARLAPDVLGADWVLSEGKDNQVFRLGDQTITADFRDFSVTFETADPAFRSPTYDSHRSNPAVRWHNGEFQRGSVARTAGREPRFCPTTGSIF